VADGHKPVGPSSLFHCGSSQELTHPPRLMRPASVQIATDPHCAGAVTNSRARFALCREARRSCRRKNSRTGTEPPLALPPTNPSEQYRINRQDDDLTRLLASPPRIASRNADRGWWDRQDMSGPRTAPILPMAL